MTASSQNAATLQFLGATGTVTGSKYLYRHEDTRLLVDCGLFQGFKQLRLRNWSPLPLDPRTLSACILTHAHIDHSGYLPLLVRNGFKGKVYCSEATHDLCRIVLPDAGHLQEEEAAYANRKGFSKHKPARPLFTEADAKRALRQLVAVAPEHDFEVGSVRVRLRPSGHILGACMVSIANRSHSVLFSGDLGRPDDPVMPAPAAVREADYLVVESTYGNRRHTGEDPQQQLADVIRRTSARGGVVLIPAFAIGRTQSLLYALQSLKSKGELPAELPVYLNSPMAMDATAIYRKHRAWHRLTEEQCRATCSAAIMVTSPEQSKLLNTKPGPMVIIAASGMATGGRVVHHLKAFAPDPCNTILFSGFQAGGTRGAAMLEGVEAVKIHGSYVPVRAEVALLDNFSAHADSAELLDWLRHFERPPRATFVTHGEPAAADHLRRRIEEEFGWAVQVPDYLERVALA